MRPLASDEHLQRGVAVKTHRRDEFSYYMAEKNLRRKCMDVLRGAFRRAKTVPYRVQSSLVVERVLSKSILDVALAAISCPFFHTLSVVVRSQGEACLTLLLLKQVLLMHLWRL
jgi:hypothetical protein